MKTRSLALLLSLAVSGASAQNFSIDWFTVAGSGEGRTLYPDHPDSQKCLHLKEFPGRLKRSRKWMIRFLNPELQVRLVMIRKACHPSWLSRSRESVRWGKEPIGCLVCRPAKRKSSSPHPRSVSTKVNGRRKHHHDRHHGRPERHSRFLAGSGHRSSMINGGTACRTR